LLRNADSRDLKGIYELISELEGVPLDYDKFECIFIQYLKEDKYHFIVEEDNGIVRGCLNLRIEYQLHHVRKIAEIMELTVKSENRSQGIGSKLLEKAIEIAKQEECFQLEVCCNMVRVNAHRFYEREEMKKSHYKFCMKLEEV
jgi:PhnO protein